MAEYKNVLIIGAGNAGKLLEKNIEREHPDCKVIGFADDKKRDSKKNAILGKIDDLSRLNKIYKVDEMVIAIPSAGGKLVRKILLNNLKNRTPIKIVPRSQRIISHNDVKYGEIRPLEAEDFLGRPFIKKYVQKLERFYKDKTILITGGAGSIGSEIVRQLIDIGTKKVIVYDNSEYLIFNLDHNLKEKGVRDRCKLIIGSVLNRNKLDYTVKREKPDVIFHAAAYKHVHLMEENIGESIETNVGGTRNAADVAIANNVQQFIFISTDKVVNPTSVMGATKKLGEFYIKSLSLKKTKFGIVRFGNVINSNGSVLPLFERQIKECGYVTVTHKKIERFFMSISEAAQLVISSAARDTSGDIHILNMEDLIKVYEVALCLIRSKNLLSEYDVKINIIGVRRGEKMTEELFTDVEKINLKETEVRDIFCLKNFEKCSIDIRRALDDLLILSQNYPNEEKIRNYLKSIFKTLKG